jgi:energy-coupling factor transporter ATP-binding protein EcfA2
MGTVTDRLKDLRSALADVPGILLDDDLARGVTDATAAVDALEHIAPDPTVVVISGPSGSGKSSLANALVGEDVAAVSSIRPTTTAITAIGAADVVHISGATEFIVTDALPSGVVIVDTPPWDRASESVAELIGRATLTFVMVTPARYGDEATHHNLAVASSAGAVVVIANRLPSSDAEREQIEDAIHERLDIKPFAVFCEHEQIRFDSSPLATLPSNDEGNATRRVLAKAAAGSSRKIATAITANAGQLGRVEQVLSETSDPKVVIGSIGTSTWEEARTQLVRSSVDLADAYDTSVERQAGNDLALRIRRSLGPVDSAAIAGELDEWRSRTTADLIEHARFGFRKTSGVRIVQEHGWVAAVNRDVPRPRRFDRMLRGAAPEIIGDASNSLLELLRAPAQTRSEEWRSILNEAGAYKPGELFAAAEAVDGSNPTDG